MCINYIYITLDFWSFFWLSAAAPKFGPRRKQCIRSKILSWVSRRSKISSKSIPTLRRRATAKNTMMTGRPSSVALVLSVTKSAFTGTRMPGNAAATVLRTPKRRWSPRRATKHSPISTEARPSAMTGSRRCRTNCRNGKKSSKSLKSSLPSVPSVGQKWSLGETPPVRPSSGAVPAIRNGPAMAPSQLLRVT